MDETFRMRNVRVVRRSSGFTLTEMLVAILVGLLVLAGVHRIFVAGITTQTITSLETEVNRKAQVAMDDLMSRLRGSSGVADAQPDKVWFVDQDDDNVRYWVSESKLYRYRGEAAGSYSGGTLVASNVSQLSFVYYDQDDQVTADAAAVRRVSSELKVTRAGHSARLTSAVKLRNK